MKRLLYRSLATIGLMGLAYYLDNPRKYNKAAKKAVTKTRNALNVKAGFAKNQPG